MPAEPVNGNTLSAGQNLTNESTQEYCYVHKAHKSYIFSEGKL